MVNVFFILICVILAIMFGKLINVDRPNISKVLARTRGTIEKDNFSYFYVHSRGPIILNLTTLFGDTDLYISNTHMYPTYDPDLYTLHSATCGVDVIEVPESFESPVAVGVYGYAESSFYVLEVYENVHLSYPYKQWVTIDKEVKHFRGVHVEDRQNAMPNENVDNKIILKKKKNRSSSNMPSVFSVLEILQLIFL